MIKFICIVSLWRCSLLFSNVLFAFSEANFAQHTMALVKYTKNNSVSNVLSHLFSGFEMKAPIRGSIFDSTRPTNIIEI